MLARLRPTMLARLRPAEGWLMFSLVLVATSMLPLSIIEARWVPGANSLILVTLLATYVGIRVGASSLRARWSVPGSLLGGAILLASVAGQIWPPISSLGRELSRSGTWLRSIAGGQWNPQIPFILLLPGIRARSLAFALRLEGWLQVGVEGGMSKDNVVLIFFLSVAAWILCWFAGWHLYRYGQPLWALLPCGVALVSNVSFTGEGEWPLRVYLASTLLLLAWVGFWQKEKRWDQEGIDYSDELRRDVTLAGAAIATIVLVVALVMPFVTSRQGIELFWRYLGEPWERVERTMDRLFAGRYQIPTKSNGGTPGGHRLGGTVQISEELVMYVSTSDPPPPTPEEASWSSEEAAWPGEEATVPQRYWRRFTYDRYTGQGWENSAEEGREEEAGEPLMPRIKSSQLVTQTYHLVNPVQEQGLGYAINEPYVVERPHTLHLRSEDDIAGFSLTGQVFGVVSQVPHPTVRQLRTVSPSSSGEFQRRYTQLPRLPRRVTRLAQEITTGVDKNIFDMATVMETYLRSFDYTLDIPTPPPGRDGVDYFLFDLRKGYCDYFATAMVVLCRSVGIPARYATGYAMGDYDYSQRAWVVREEAAHAWVEVYFDEYGWIKFEPTPPRSTFARFFATPSGEMTLSQMRITLEPEPGIGPVWWWRLTVLPLVSLVMMGMMLMRWLQRRTLRAKSAGERVKRLYDLMVQWVSRAGMGPRPAQTPAEFVVSLGERLEAAAADAAADAEGQTADLRQALSQIRQAYVAETYAPYPVPDKDARMAEDAWRRLRSVLWRAAVLHKARLDRTA